ncbi:hypothetical protein KIN20_015327 [Parelaphostrongylus tenuis]|uniref:Uncharacterized protein n=1 Tax=Parelaphostrongylus tenuis TaxID=148309 RepID=A0AAD5MJC7_PARTN|nr:hypothetical protein KIN20_015327 [Parelaphostrongylus tenuis]
MILRTTTPESCVDNSGYYYTTRHCGRSGRRWNCSESKSDRLMLRKYLMDSSAALARSDISVASTIDLALGTVAIWKTKLWHNATDILSGGERCARLVLQDGARERSRPEWDAGRVSPDANVYTSLYVTDPDGSHSRVSMADEKVDGWIFCQEILT